MKFNNSDIEKKVLGLIGVSFQLIGGVIIAMLMFFLLFGAMASIIILYKICPELGTELIFKLFEVVKALTFILKLILVFSVICFIIWYCLLFVWVVEKSKEKRRIKREEFLKDLVIRLKKMGVGVTKTKHKK